MPFPARELLTLVVVTHESAQHLDRFFATWHAAIRRWPDRPALVVADSGSTDATHAAVAGASPAAELVALQNVGFGAAANAGIARANTPWILLCNPDLSFPADFAEQLEYILPQGPAEGVDWVRRTAIFAPRLLNDDETIQPSAGRFPTIGSLLADQFRARPNRKYLHPQPEAESRIDWASAPCLLIRKAAFDAVGGFDPTYFLYVEEVDLQRRLGDAGWDVRAAWPIVPEWKVTHLTPNARRSPRPEVQRYAARGLLHYFARHGTLGQLSAYRLLAFFSRRLPLQEAFASRAAILARRTGP